MVGFCGLPQSALLRWTLYVRGAFFNAYLFKFFAMPDHLRLVCSSLGSLFQRSAVRTRRSEGIAEDLQSPSFTEGSRLNRRNIQFLRATIPAHSCARTTGLRSLANEARQPCVYPYGL